MRNKAILVSFVALFAMILTLSAVSALDFVTVDRIEVNGVATSYGTTYVGQVSDTVPIEVQFTANEDVSQYVKVKVSIEGYKDNIEQYVTLRTPLQSGVSGYVARLSLKLPSSMDLSDLSEDTTLNVRIYSKDDSVYEYRKIRMERDLYSLNILSIDAANQANAGSTVELAVVLQNNGNKRLDNVYVRASIPELGVERRVYFGDLDSTAEVDLESIRDSVERKVYLTIPSNAAPGTYNIQVEAYNYDTSTTAKKVIEISSLGSGVLPGTSAKTVSVGGETSFDLVIVNPNNKMVVYSITPETSPGLSISVDKPIVAVPADSSMTVKVNVKATDSAEVGTHLVTVNVNSDTGATKQVSYSLTVESGKSSTGNGSSPIAVNGVLILTVVLVIIFVVLLVVLIVLLTRKPKETEEFGETSYY